MFAYRLAAALAALALTGSGPAFAQPAASPATRIITLTSYAFSPSPLRLAAGRPVTLTLMNQAGKSHNFTAPAFFARARILAGSAPRGRIELKGGTSASITLVPAAGTYKVHCSHFLHSGFGMNGAIIVG